MNYLRLIINFEKYAVFLMCALLIAISVVSVSEISSRIGVRSFLNERISVHSSEISKMADDKVSQSLDKRSQLRSNIILYESILDDLRYLELSGSETEEQELGRLRFRMQSVRREADNAKLQTRVENEIVGLKDRNSALEAELQGVLSKIKIERLILSKLESENIRLQEQMQSSEQKLSALEEDLRLEIAGVTDGLAGRGARARDIEFQIEALRVEIDKEQQTRVEKEIEFEAVSSRLSNLNFQEKTIREQLSRNESKLELLESPSFSEEISLNDPNGSNGSLYYRYNPFSGFPTEFILAICMIACGALGAAITALRVNRRAAASIFYGMLAGFVAFLVVKGGRFVFLVNMGAHEDVFLNPFTLAFSAILAGMFTDKAYGLMESTVDSAIERLKNEPDANDKPEPVK